eukprot:TRINITY_DN89727_c0_g1_i1.p2 TRINITY_DN89727_c0_g1~~TRINITY_DN89727_c0_g1_i1.p2  ORF type:complete len:107 (-),score=25.91 TRINITY_DN89727_c0_g1_i1:288-608(-)
MAQPKRRLGEEFEVVIGGGASAKWRLGAFTFKEHSGLRIAAVHASGALADWNKSHPEREVKNGDLVVEVDMGEKGTRGNGAVIYDELLKAQRPCKLWIGAGPLHGG